MSESIEIIKSEAEDNERLRRYFQDTKTYGLTPEEFRGFNAVGGDKKSHHRYFNKKLLDAAFSDVDPKSIAINQDLYRNAYAEQMWGETEMDESAFYKRQGEEFNREEQIGEAAQIAAMKRMSATPSFAKWKAEQGEEKLPRESVYLKAFSDVHTATMKRLAPYRGIISDVSSNLEKLLQQEGGRVQRDSETGYFALVDDAGSYEDIARKLLEVADDDIELVVSAIGANASVEGDKTWASKLGERLGRGTVNLGSNAESLFFRAASSVRANAPFTAIGETEEERLQNVAQVRKLARIDEAIRDVAQGEIDPAKGEYWITKGLYGAAESVPYTLTALVPGGLALTSLALGDQAFDTLGVYAPDMSFDQKVSVAAVSGPIMAFTEYVGARWMQGKLPSVFKLLNKPTLVGSGNLGRLPIRIAGVTGLEMVQENFQDATPIIVGALAGALSEDMPEINWQSFLEQQTKNLEHQSELLAISLIFGVWGGGAASWKEIEGSRMFASSVGIMKANGISAADAAEIRKLALADDMDGAQEMLREKWSGTWKTEGHTVPESLNEARNEYIKEIHRKNEAKEEAGTLGFAGHITKQGEVYSVTFADDSVAKFETVKEAQAAVDADLEDQVLGLHQDQRNTLVRLIGGLSSNEGIKVDLSPEEMTLRRQVDEGEVTEEKAMERVEIAAKDAGESIEEWAAKAKNRGELLANGEGDVLAFARVLGSNKIDPVGIVRTNVIKLFSGANFTDLIEEKLEGDAKNHIADGRRDWVLNAIREVEIVMDTELLLSRKDEEVSDQQLIEAYSTFGKAYSVGRDALGSATEKEILGTAAGPVLDGYTSLFSMIIEQAKVINEAREAGKLPAEFERELSKQLGLEEQQAFEEETDQEVSEIIREATGEDVRFESGEANYSVTSLNLAALNPDASFRVIVGDEAFRDIVESGVVRTNADKKGGETLADRLLERPVSFPSFSKGKVSLGYANSNPNHYIIETTDPSIQPSTKGRHGKGTTQFPTDSNGEHQKSLSGDVVNVHKHTGDGQYELVYSMGKPVQDSINYSVTKADALKARVSKMTADEVRERLDKARLTPTRDMVAMLGQFPEYLNPVIDYIMAKRDELIEGKTSARDLAKAYWITIASIGADAIDVSTIQKKAAENGIEFNPDPIFFAEGKKGQAQMRPEELAAYWLGTDQGQRALNNIEKGVFDISDWEEGLTLRDAFGRNDLREKTKSDGVYVPGAVGSPKDKQFNLQNLSDALDAIRGAKGDPAKLEKALTSINGIGEGKKGFIGHLLGFGEWATLDAVELNMWLTGKGETTYASDRAKEMAAIAKRASGKKSESADLFNRIRKRIKGLRKTAAGGSQIPEEVAAHIIHHWIWDAGKGLETTHEGVYYAMVNYSVSIVGSNAIADSKGVPGTIPDEYVGRRVLPIMADRLAGGGQVLGVDVTGGPAYPLMFSDVGKRGDDQSVWASTESGVKGILSDLKKTGAIFTDGDGIRRALVSAFLMGEDAHQSNINFFTVAIKHIEEAIAEKKFSASQEKTLANFIRSQAKNKIEADHKAAVKKWENRGGEATGKPKPKPGKKLSQLLDFPLKFTANQLDNYADNLSFEARLFFSKQIGSAAAENIGIPSVPKMLSRSRDPDLSNVEKTSLVNLLEINVDELESGLKSGTLTADDFGIPRHLSYDTVIPGKLVAHFRRPVPADIGIGSILDHFKKNSPKSRPDYLLAGLLIEGTKAQELTPKVIAAINDIQGTQHTQAQAKAYIAGIMNSWKELKGNNQAGLKSFLKAIKANEAAETLSDYDYSTLSRHIRMGHMEVYKLPDLDVYFGLKRGEIEVSEKKKRNGDTVEVETLKDTGKVDLVSVVNNTNLPGALNFIMAKALAEGANTLDAFAVPIPGKPDGLLPTIYSRHGWKVARKIEYDPFYEDVPGTTPKRELKKIHEAKVKVWEAQGWTLEAGQKYPDVVFMEHGGIGTESSADPGDVYAGVAGVTLGITGSASEVSAGGNAQPDSAPGSRGGDGGTAGRGGGILPRGSDSFLAELKLASPERQRFLGITPGERKAILAAGAKATSYSVVRGPAPARFQAAFDPFQKSPELRRKIGHESLRRAIIAGDEWRNLIKQHKRFVDDFDQKRLIKALRTVNAIMAALPPEIRAKLGVSYIQIAGFKTDEGRMRSIEKTISKIDKELEFYLRKDARERIQKIAEKSIPKRKAGEKVKGSKLGAMGHALFDFAFLKVGAVGHGVAYLSPGEASLKADGYATKLANGLEEADIQAASEIAGETLDAGDAEILYEELERITRTVGGSLWGSVRGQLKSRNTMDAADMEAAREFTDQLWTQFRSRFLIDQELEKERRKKVREEAITDSGGNPADRRARKKRILERETPKGSAKNIALNLLSLDGIAEYVFGENSKIYKWLSDTERKASNKSQDARIALGEDVEELFTTLAGGKRFDGMKLRHKLSEAKHDVQGELLSEMEIIDALMTWRQPDGERHMIGHLDENGDPSGSWNFDQDWVDEAEALLSPEAVEVMDYLTTQYQLEWFQLNPVYRLLNGVNLPRNLLYAPISVKPVQTSSNEMSDPVTGGAAQGLSATPGWLKTRGKSAIAEPEFKDAMAKFLAHRMQVEYWIAYAPFVREAKSVLSNREVGNAVDSKQGNEATKLLRKWVDVAEMGGIRDSAAFMEINQTLNRWLGRASAIAIIGRIGTVAVQMTQLGAASAKMPAHSYAIRLGKLFAGQLGWADAVRSPYIQRRIKEMSPLARQAMEGLASAKPSQLNEMVRTLGKSIPIADGLFTAGTYAIVLDYQTAQNIKLGMSPTEAARAAHEETERIVDKLAQPTRTGARSLYEVSSTSPLGRSAWNFASEPRKNLALIILAQMEHGFASKEFFRASVTYAILLNGLGATLIRSIWKDARDDDDDELFDAKHWNPETLALASVTDWMSGFPLVGEAVQGGIYAATGTYQPQGNLFSAIERAMGGVRYLDDILEGDMDLNKTLRFIEALLSAGGIFNAHTASLASLAHIVRDLAGVAENVTTD